MKQRAIAVLCLTACLLVLLSAPALGQGPINRKVLHSPAKSLDNQPEAAKERADELVIGVPNLLGEINPFWARTTGDQYASQLLFDELLFSDNNGDVGPGVAEFALSADRRTITFTLRDEVRYMDGTPLTSDDYINALYLLLTPGFDGVYDLWRAGIAGVEAYLEGESGEIEGICRLSDRSFSVTLAQYTPDCLLCFAIPALRTSLAGDMRRPDALVDPLDFAAFYAEALSAAREADVAAMAYGQYALEAWAEGEEAVFSANGGYWRGAPYIGSLRLKAVPVGREVEAILSGEVDIISSMGSVETVDRVSDIETDFINLYTWEGDVVGYLGMDLENALFSDENVRHALAAGFNRQQARLDSVERYGVLPGMLLFDSFGANDIFFEELYPHDPERAAQLLDEAGWVMGEEGIRRRDSQWFAFSLYYNTPNPILEKMLPRLEADWSALGLEVTLVPTSFEELIELVDKNACDMYFMARRLPSSAALAADLFMGDSHLNALGYHSERLDRILRKLEDEEDPARRTVIYEELYQELYQELPFIPLYRRSEVLLVNARVMNVVVTGAHDITSDVYRFFLVDTLEGQW